MNGGGKLWPDPANTGRLFGKAGDIVQIGIISDIGPVRLAAVTYSGLLHFTSDHFALRIQPGYAVLSILPEATGAQEITLREIMADGILSDLLKIKQDALPQISITIVGLE